MNSSPAELHLEKTGDLHDSDFLGSLSTLRRLCERSPARFIAATTAALYLLVAVVMEVLLGWPFAAWHYGLLATLGAIALVPWRPGGSRRLRITIFTALLLIMAGLHWITWNDVKAFNQKLGQIYPGMSEAEVRQIMSRYPEGTGWPAVYGAAPENPGALIDSSSTYTTGRTPAGEMTLADSLVFRAGSDPGDSNWGIVTFENGRVTHVSFSPD